MKNSIFGQIKQRKSFLNTGLMKMAQTYKVCQYQTAYVQGQNFSIQGHRT